MAIAERSGSRATAQADNVALGQAALAGSAIVVFVYWDGTGSPTITSVTDGTNTYTLIGATVGPVSSELGRLAVALNVAAGTPTITANFSSAPGYVRIRVTEFTGVATSAAIDKSSQNTGAFSNPSTTGSMTPDADGQLILSAHFGSDQSAWTPMASPAFTEIHDQASNAWQFYVQPSAGAINPEMTTTPSASDWAAMGVTLREAAGGGAVFYNDVEIIATYV